MKTIFSQIKRTLSGCLIGLASLFNVASSRFETNAQSCGMIILGQRKKPELNDGSRVKKIF
ncbi:hypothetical protein [Mucilaginibacter gynuensis]|uniref:hypothetical protein n=1 Tax=Mucilaginibacter gynuensis TaxID=1302236 RepID=UPI0031E90660